MPLSDYEMVHGVYNQSLVDRRLQSVLKSISRLEECYGLMRERLDPVIGTLDMDLSEESESESGAEDNLDQTGTSPLCRLLYDFSGRLDFLSDRIEITIRSIEL